MENTEKKECACACACGSWCKSKWFPHNWFNLKVIAIINIVLFYVAIGFTLFQLGSLWYYIFTFDGPVPYGRALMDSGFILVSGVLIGVGFLTIAKIIKILKKIKHAVVVK